MSPAAFSFAAVAAAVWSFFADVDTGVLANTARLVTAPGALVRQQLAKRKEVFREPLRLFVVANLVFFLIGPSVGLFRFSLESLEETHPLYPRVTAAQQQELGLTRAVYTERFDNHLSFRQPTFAALLVPLLALFAKLFDLRRLYGVHLMFALWGVSWILLASPLVLLAVDAVAAGLGHAGHPAADAAKLGLLLLAILQWFVRAQRGGYGRGPLASLLQGLLLTASWVVATAIYGQALFWLTWVLLPVT